MKVHVLYRLRQLKAELRIVQFGIAITLRFARFQQRAIALQRFIFQLAADQFVVIVVEEFDFAAQVRFLLVERQDFESPRAASQDVHPPVGIAGEHFFHLDRAAGARNPRVLDPYDAEFSMIRDRLADQFLVAFFENMQWHLDPGNTTSCSGKSDSKTGMLLLWRFMILKLKRTPGIYLVGFMGGGKTTIGERLARRIGWHFADLDHDIEKAHGATVQQIFAEHGEQHFRRLEHAALKQRINDVERGRPSVVALGGGTFVCADNYALLENNGVTLWLDAPFELIRQRVPSDGSRPLATDPVEFRKLFDSRGAGYGKADHRIPIVSEDPEVTIDSILALQLFGS